MTLSSECFQSYPSILFVHLGGTGFMEQNYTTVLTVTRQKLVWIAFLYFFPFLICFTLFSFISSFISYSSDI